MPLSYIIVFFIIFVSMFAGYSYKYQSPECTSRETVIAIKQVSSNYSTFLNQNNEILKVYNKSYMVGDEICSSETEKETK